MLKRLLIAVSGFAILLLVAVSYLTARFVDHEEILRARLEAEQLRATRDSIDTVVAKRDSLERELESERDRLVDEASRLRARVSELERERAQAQLTVRRLRRNEDLQQRLRQTFPEMAASDWGITEVHNEAEDVGVEYLLVPLWFSETFIIDHQNSLAYEAMTNTLLAVDSLQSVIFVLGDSITGLERENRLAYESGFREALVRYDSLNEKYIGLLEKPPHVTLGVPKWGWMLGSAAAGVVVGTQVKN